MDSLEIDFGDISIKSAPIAMATGVDAASNIFGIGLHDWFYVMTIAYVVVQIWALIYKTLKLTKGGTKDG